MNARTIAGMVLAVSLGTAAVGIRSGQAEDFDAWREFDSRVIKGFRIAPVRLNLKGKNPRLVGLRSYIVNAQGGCNDCHTAPPYEEGGNPFMGQPEQINREGYLAGGVAFGPITSRNLTPRANGRPANLTWDQFREVMRKGTDFKNRHPEISPLLQVMPWPVYGNMNSLDLLAIYEYLKAIPSRPTPMPPPATTVAP
jgi:hypothetical protein